MKRIIAMALVLLGGGCAGYDGRSLVPGQASTADVEKAMGRAAEQRAAQDGETVLWFPRLPYGRVSYAARIGEDGKLVAVEQRLTRENLDRLKPGAARESDVRDLLGPPQRVDAFPRLERQAWTYQAQGIQPQLIVVQFSQDRILREVYMFDDPEYMTQQSSD
jgi:hypothetical protein